MWSLGKPAWRDRDQPPLASSATQARAGRAGGRARGGRRLLESLRKSDRAGANTRVSSFEFLVAKDFVVGNLDVRDGCSWSPGPCLFCHQLSLWPCRRIDVSGGGE